MINCLSQFQRKCQILSNFRFSNVRIFSVSENCKLNIIGFWLFVGQKKQPECNFHCFLPFWTNQKDKKTTIMSTHSIDYLYHAKCDTLLMLMSSNYNILSENKGSGFKNLIKANLLFHITTT